ncbi:E3 ubiquitin-protein ligase rnf213-beta isoform X2 [Brachyhypopomus gauderio]|uniref:E3 ubiquitin-protein ligase rnf213-beta isoform X2 n=1 Tax=Brachyhypopomus gauderio TaxID=698409 RepID=UPI004042683B
MKRKKQKDRKKGAVNSHSTWKVKRRKSTRKNKHGSLSPAPHQSQSQTEDVPSQGARDQAEGSVEAATLERTNAEKEIDEGKGTDHSVEESGPPDPVKESKKGGTALSRKDVPDCEGKEKYTKKERGAESGEVLKRSSASESGEVLKRPSASESGEVLKRSSASESGEVLKRSFASESGEVLKRSSASESGEVLKMSFDSESGEVLKMCSDSESAGSQRSYAAVVSRTEQTKDVKQQANQTAVAQEVNTAGQGEPGKTSLGAGPGEKQKFTFYVYIVVDKRFNFSREHDKLLLLFTDSDFQMEMTNFRSFRDKGYLIEANFSVDENMVPRGNRLEYTYAVLQRQKVIREVAMRRLWVPQDRSVKELHLFESYMSRSGSFKDWLRSWIKSAEKELSEAWHFSAHVLLDRLFEKWEPSNQKSMQEFVQLLNHYQRDLLASRERVFYPEYLPTPVVMVPQLIERKLVKILGGPSKCTADLCPLTLGLSVFQVCCACSVNLGIKNWGTLCHMVSSDSALKQLEQMKDTFPILLHMVMGLMNRCARSLVSELVLLVPLLHALRSPGTSSAHCGPAVEEPDWAGLHHVEYRLYREKMRAYPDKRRMMLNFCDDNKSVAKEKQHVLRSWLSMVAYDDITAFAKSTNIGPEHLIQCLMYRLKEFELNKYQTETDFEHQQKNLEITEEILRHALKWNEEDKNRIMHCEYLDSIFEGCIHVHKSTCKITRCTSRFKATVSSFQKGEDKVKEKKLLLSQLENLQREFSQWRDGLLRRPLFHQSRFTYSREMEIWNAFLELDCLVDCVREQWLHTVESDLRKRISELSDMQRVQVCCLEVSAQAIKNSHSIVQTCFQDSCRSGISNICQAGKEGHLLLNLLSDSKSLSSSVLSSILLDSAARCKGDTVTQLLDAQSAIHVLLSHGDWNQWKVNEEASQLIESCLTMLRSMATSLCQGDIPLGHLLDILKHSKHFERLYKNCKTHKILDNISIDAEELLIQRKKDLQALREQRKHMDVLIKMIAKISEMIHVPEISLLEEQHRMNQNAVSLNKLVEVQPCFSKEAVSGLSTGRALCYSTDPALLHTAMQMYELHDSNLLLFSWVEKATALASATSSALPVSLSMMKVFSEIWEPSLHDFCNLGVRIAYGVATFEEVDKVVDGCGDEGKGTQIKKELDLMATKMEMYQDLDKDWPKLRLSQIQDYRQLYHAGKSASAILKIRDKLNLKGDFSHICWLTQLREDSFKRKALQSLSNDLIRAKQRLLNVKHQHTACLEAFLESGKLVTWVKTHIKNLSELKVFMELASISAGENDAEIDRLAGFHDAVMGYSPLLYSLNERAGFEDLIACAEQVWDTLQRDEKLSEKLRDSSRWLDWLKSLRETHGSVEQSSLSLASAINNHGVYNIGWPAGSSGKKCLGSVLCMKVMNSERDKTYSLDELLELQNKTYSLDELLELQNKLMLMSSKGEHGKDQVNKFTEVFEGVQRMGHILLQLHSSGNVFFQDMRALVKCNSGNDPCINVHFPLLGKHVVYHGHVAESLQEVCRSMEACHEDWRDFMSDMRCRFHALNNFTSEQLVYLCHWIHKICVKGKSVPQQIWYLLNPLNPGSSLNDIRDAFTKARKSTESLFGCQIHASSELLESKDNANQKSDTENMVEEPTNKPETGSEVSMLQEDSEVEGGIFAEGNQCEMEVLCNEPESLEHVTNIESHHSTQVQEEAATETLRDLWRHFRRDMPTYLKEYVDIELLARFLSNLSGMNQLYISRNMPSILQEGRPNLVHCPASDLIRTTLCFYAESPEQNFPSTDEVLVCHENTNEEEVEIFLRRCLGRGVLSSQQKIYTLVNPGLLSYDVSVAMAERFEAMERSAGSHYRLIMVCPVNQDRYIPSFFSNYKVQAVLNISAERIQKYLQNHLTAPFGSLFQAYPNDLSSWMITSKRPAVGKSLYVKRMFQHFSRKFPSAHYLPIRLIEPSVDVDLFIQIILDKLSPLREEDPVLLHIDAGAVRSGLDEFIFRLLVLGCLCNSEGKLWRRNTAHLVAVEALLPDPAHQIQAHKESNQGLLHLLPTIHCRPPKEVKELEHKIRNYRPKHVSLDPLMDRQEFESEGVQRPYQYLKRFNRHDNLDNFKYKAKSVEGNQVDCLRCLLSNCGLEDPSWAELKHFTWFLNLQLKDCENSAFCDPDFLGDSLRGFKNFIVKFMIHMARDFASPSLDISDQSFFQKSTQGDDLLARLTIRKRWENESHPYIFFNADHLTMTFLGFHVEQNSMGTLNAVDPRNSNILMADVMSYDLFSGLQEQRISFSEDFDKLPRVNKIKKLSFVVGAKVCDPDPTYELTADNVMKMLAIHMRFRCEIPVVIMGETGCGKTRLVKFLCDLQRENRDVENMKLVKVHGGTTADTIYQKVKEAERLAEKNTKKYSVDTILFFDEANTTECIFAIKEVLCDKTVKGIPLKKNTGLKIIAACNPYRRHSTNMIDRLERAGLGYRVKAEETDDRLGKVPMRQLVYRVHPLPPSMMPLVWDFGQLSDETELSYIYQIVQKQMKEHCLPLACQKVVTRVLAKSQSYMRSQEDECSFVSLRDVERSMKVLIWFYQHRDHLFPNCQSTDEVQMTLKCLALALGVCYYPSLESREKYLFTISMFFPSPLNSREALEDEISSCQDFFLENIRTRETIAKNLALKENVFLMVICIELRIPLFLVGKPGSSKSLAKTVIADAMQRQASHCDLFHKLKEVHMVSFQCSPHSSPEGIIGTFRNCARFQKDKNMDEYISVVVLDEIGLAEDSPQMPLKTLHPLLEDGCIDSEKPEPHMKVGFVGISNWALDPAKMNRGIFVSRWDPSENELVETANGICSSSPSVVLKIKHLLPKLAKGFISICKSDNDQFFGLRDYYSLVKMIFMSVKKSEQEPNDTDLAEAILRNFSGQKGDFDPLNHFKDLFFNFDELPRTSTLNMIEQNLDFHNNKESRYLLLLTTNNAALYIVQQCIFSKDNYTCPEIVFGSGFPKDQEYAQICRNVSRVKTCMETGRTVILLNLLNLYESLYDALNQYYVYFSGQQYVDLGLGSHRVKCRVHRDFRLVVIEDQEKVYDKFPIPLKNRLEKHKVDRSTDLAPWQRKVLEKLTNWVQTFSQFSRSLAPAFSPTDAFVGFHGDACASALLQALERKAKQDNPEVGDSNIIFNMPIEKDSVSMPTEDGSMSIYGDIKENQSQVDTEGEGSGSNQIIPDDEKTNMTDSGVESGVHKVLSDEDAEGHVLIHDNLEDIEYERRRGETLENISEEFEEMDIGLSDLETIKNNVPNATKDEEEDVYESAKYFLLNCATPDSVLRLKYSQLGNQEVDRIQKLCFHQQGHHSLRAFMNGHLQKTDKEKNRFIEVTTFSNLLTKADVRDLTRALGLSVERILLLSLHQFDTEASFCSKIRYFLQNAGLSLHILLVQMDIEDSPWKNELIASAKYCTMNELQSLPSEDRNSYIVFVTKLARISSGNKYIGFQGGAWLSIHIDDLRDTDDMSLDLSVYCGKPISKLLSQSRQQDVMEIDQDRALSESQPNESAYLHSLSLVRSCTQKAVSLLRDPVNMASRSMDRMQILLGLLENDPGRTGTNFQQILLARLVVAMEQREELIPEAKDWVNKEAMKQEALQEGGTLRHTLWRCLQTVLTPTLAQMFEVLDRDSNLNLLCGAGLSEGLVQFWLDIFSDGHILDFTRPQSPSASEQEINIQCNLFVSEEQHNCSAPFSWLIRLYCQDLWEESQFVQSPEQSNEERILQFVSAVRNSSLGGYIYKLSETEQQDLGQKYLTDFVLLSFRIQSEQELKVYRSAVLGCVAALQQALAVSPSLTPAWVTAAARVYSSRLDALSHMLRLQPHIVPLLLTQNSHDNRPDMCEDILALGICVEETKLQHITSLPACQSFLRRVEMLQPSLQRAFTPEYSSLCSPGCLTHLDAIKTVWLSILVIAAFIEQVVVRVNPQGERLLALTLTHCSQLQRLMEECPDLRDRTTLQQLIRVLNDYSLESTSRELRFGLKCPVCLGDLSEPCALNCEHVFCLSCLTTWIQGQGPKQCPKCRASLPPNYQPTVSTSVESALRQHRDVRRCCNSFFLEVVSRFCLCEGQRPQEDMVELLFSILISAQGDVYKTRELTPFLECVDQNPVARSVLPKLLLQHSFDQVKGHIQAYLGNLEQKLLDDEDRTELYRMFVNCFQDCLPGLGQSASLEAGEACQRQQEDIQFLGRVARRQAPLSLCQPADFLLTMARLRACLDTAASVLPRALGLKTGSCAEWELKLLEQVKAVCEYGDNDWYRVYLLRALSRLAGSHCVQALLKSSMFEWVLPAELLRLQRLVPADVDRFLCCGQLYRLLRDGVGQTLLDGSTKALRDATQNAGHSGSVQSVLLSLALFRQVNSHPPWADPALRPELDPLIAFVRENTVGHLRDLCTSLLTNQPGGVMSNLHISGTVSAGRRPLLELLVHASAVFNSGNRLLHPLHLIACRPQTMTEVFLPTMPDDNTSEVFQWLKEEKLKMYTCTNGHPCMVGECGKPMMFAKCDTCGVKIGGQNHSPAPGFTPVHGRAADKTRQGHILGEAGRRSDAPNRGLLMPQSCVLRLCLHLSMLHGSALNNQGIRAMIHPVVHDISEFLWGHVEKDMEVLGKSLSLNWDDTAIIIHLILNTAAHLPTDGVQQRAAQLSSRQAREQWEKRVCQDVIDPTIKDFKRKLGDAQEHITQDSRLSGSALMMVLKGDPSSLLSLPTHCPTHHTAFWTPPDTLTTEHLAQVLAEKHAGNQVPLLSLFLDKVPYIRQLACLPDLAALLSDLMRVVPAGTETHAHSVGTLLRSRPAGYQRNTLTKRIKSFFKVWNHLRMELENNAAVGVDPDLCSKDISMESSADYLTLSRRGPGSCLHSLVDLLSDTHNSLVREARKLSHQEEQDSDYSVPVGAVSESHLALCHPEKELLPLVLAHCQYTLEKGQQTASDYDLQAIERQLYRRFLAGKPRILTETDKYLKRHHQDFSEVLKDVRTKIPQGLLKSSVCSSTRAGLRSFTDVCDGLDAVEIGLRFLSKTGGQPKSLLLSYLKDNLRMDQHISSSVAKALAESRLDQCIATWQLFTCWRSEMRLWRGQDPLPKLSKDFKKKLSREERKDMTDFLDVTDVELFTLELHEILLLKTDSTSQTSYSSEWDIRSTMESHLEEKGVPVLPGLDILPEAITLSKAADVWRLAVKFKR